MGEVGLDVGLAERGELEAALGEYGYVADEVRDASDQPGRELVFFGRRPK